jgi:hypothetical protein
MKPRRCKHWVYLNDDGKKLYGDVFPDGDVPVLSTVPTTGGIEGNPERLYLLFHEELTEEQREDLLTVLAQKFSADKEAVRHEMLKNRIPIRSKLVSGAGSDCPCLFDPPPCSSWILRRRWRPPEADGGVDAVRMTAEKENIVMVCLDACRYDTFQAVQPANMLRVGPLQRAYSFACWTMPSIIGYLQGIPPLGVASPPPEKEHGYLFQPFERFAWAPKYFLERGYITAYFSANPIPAAYNLTSGRAFQRYFLEYHAEYDVVGATPEVLKDFAEVVATHQRSPLFVFMLWMDTHPPFFDGKLRHYNRGKVRVSERMQRRALRYDDGLFKVLLYALGKTGRRSHVVVTSDHGELFGDETPQQFFGHDPSDRRVGFHRKLFEIPFVQGHI